VEGAYLAQGRILDAENSGRISRVIGSFGEPYRLDRELVLIESWRHITARRHGFHRFLFHRRNQSRRSCCLHLSIGVVRLSPAAHRAGHHSAFRGARMRYAALQQCT
jgi:hypothetical protein